MMKQLHVLSIAIVMSILCMGTLTSDTYAQNGQWAFGATPNEQSRRLSDVPSGGTVGCGADRIFRLDSAANVMWMLAIEGFYPEAVISTSDGGFASVGLYIVDNVDRFTMLVKMDPGGNVDWYHFYPGAHNDELTDFVEVLDPSGNADGFVIVNAHDGVDFSRVPFVIRTKVDGSPMWMKRYVNPNFQSTYGDFSFIQLGFGPQGEMFMNLVGEIADNGIQAKRDTLLTRLNMNGDFVVGNMIGFEDDSDFGRGLTRYLNDDFLVTGYSKEFGEGGGTYLMRVDQDFNLIWYDGIYGFTGTKEIYLNGDGHAVLTGTTTNPNPVQNAALIAVSPVSRSLVWGMQYGDSDPERSADFARIPNGYAVLGSTYSFDIFPSEDFYYVKTDEFGKSGCNETEYRPDILSFDPPETSLTLVPTDVEPINQLEVSWQFVEYKWRALCDSPPKPCACVKPPIGMTAWWTLDDPTGTIAVESIAGLDGNHVDNPVITPGKVDNALLFDGIDDFVKAPSGPTVNVPASQGSPEFGSFSIDAWIRIDSADTFAWGAIFEKRSENGGPGYAFYVHDGVLNLAMNDGSASMIFESNQVLPVGSYVHVAVAVNRAVPGEVRFFVDGVSDVAIQPMSMYGTLANDAAVWIGAMRYGFAPGDGRRYFNGIIDEVEFFDRPLDDSEVIAIYEAQECGKCKFSCEVAWDIPFCIDDNQVITTVTVCNYSPNPAAGATIEMNFAPLSPPGCGNIVGPTGYAVVSPSNPFVVPANSCINVDVLIDRPIGMNALYDAGCFEVILNNLDNGYQCSCMGSVIDRRDLCPDPVGDPVVITPDIDFEIDITVTNTGVDIGFVDWRAVVYAPGMNAISQNIGINGNAPGEFVSGELNLELGETKTLSLKVRAENFEGLSRSDLVLFTRSNQNGLLGNEYFALVSVGIVTELERADCIGDLTGDGKVDGADLAIVLGSWGECVGCASDLNGDDIVNGEDLTLLLGNWGDC